MWAEGMVMLSSPGEQRETQGEERLVEKVDMWFACYHIFSLLGPHVKMPAMILKTVRC